MHENNGNTIVRRGENSKKKKKQKHQIETRSSADGSRRPTRKRTSRIVPRDYQKKNLITIAKQRRKRRTCGETLSGQARGNRKSLTVSTDSSNGRRTTTLLSDPRGPLSLGERLAFPCRDAPDVRKSTAGPVRRAIVNQSVWNSFVIEFSRPSPVSVEQLLFARPFGDRGFGVFWFARFDSPPTVSARRGTVKTLSRWSLPATAAPTGTVVRHGRGGAKSR